VKRISTGAYQALREALAVVTWNKRPFESLLRTALRDSPGLLSGLNFIEPKRVVADALVARLAADEDRYRDVTLTLMLEVAEMVRFPNIEQITEPSDRELRLEAARTAVDHLKTLTDGYRETVTTREQAEVAREAYLAQQQSLRQFGDDVESLRQQFMDLHNSIDARDRGIQFERLLTDLCVLFDMEPRLAYSLSNEQLDGSLSYDTDDYIVEARWRSEPTDRGDLDIFAAKVRRKGKNALGLFVSLNGFTAAALDCYRGATPFLAVDGADLFYVFEGRLRWDDLLKAKKRHANETGNCMLSAVTMMSE
jgi:hypothetical protein